MREPRIRDQLAAVRSILRDTRKRELEWTWTGDEESEGSYTSKRDTDVATLDRTEEELVRLRFLTADRPEWSVEIIQLGSATEPSKDEEDRDGLLALLYDLVSQQVGGRDTNAMLRFTNHDRR